MSLISRLAPTPSGFLHAGNALNFIATWLLVRSTGGRLHLRVDDLDTTRTRPEYLRDLFETLEWMELDWDEGPKSVQELESCFSQKLRRSRYLEALHDLLRESGAYVCACSRTILSEKACTCPTNGLSFDPDSSVVRIPLQLENGESRLVTLWRREGIPAYQLVSLLDDLDHGVNTIVRGADLLESTLIQRALARKLPERWDGGRFLQIRFYHHPLLPGPDGEKLSKSKGSDSLRTFYPRAEGPARLYLDLSPLFGIQASKNSLKELLSTTNPLESFATWLMPTGRLELKR
jgi:glutamyl-tRNA synthetase